MKFDAVNVEYFPLIHHSIRVTLPKEMKMICDEFSRSVITTTIEQYKKRNQSDVEKLIMDHSAGKLGEIAVHCYLKYIKISCSEPDFNIYTNNKSFEADLHSMENKIHVKSQLTSQAQIFGTSWVFHHDTNGSKDPIFINMNGNEFIAFCEIMDDTKIIIHCIPKSRFIVENQLFDDPLSTKLIGKKKVVYLSKMMDTRYNNWDFGGYLNYLQSIFNRVNNRS